MTEQDRPSKTRIKRQMHELQAIGERLVSLSAAQLDTMELPEDLRDALDQAHRVSGRESRRRHMQYIGRLMRAVDPDPIREKIASWDGQLREHTTRFHGIERWRDRLLENDDALDELLREHSIADAQRLRALIRSARTERNSARPSKSYRELFRLLRDVLPAENA